MSNAENALTAKRTSGSDPVKMCPGVLFVAGFVSKEDFFFPFFLWRKKMVLICLKVRMGKKSTDGKHCLEE